MYVSWPLKGCKRQTQDLQITCIFPGRAGGDGLGPLIYGWLMEEAKCMMNLLRIRNLPRPQTCLTTFVSVLDLRTRNPRACTERKACIRH